MKKWSLEVIGDFVDMRNNTGDQDIWIIARQRNGIVQRVSFELLARARELVRTDLLSDTDFSTNLSANVLTGGGAPLDEETNIPSDADEETNFSLANQSENSDFDSADDTTVLSVLSDDEIRQAWNKESSLLNLSSNTKNILNNTSENSLSDSAKDTKNFLEHSLKASEKVQAEEIRSEKISLGEVMNCPKRANGQINAILLAPELPDSELEKLLHYGADRVWVLESPEFAEFIPDLQAEVLCSFVREQSPAVVLFVADSVGRTLAPYCAMRLHTGLTADCTQLAIDRESGLLLQTRPAIGGNIMATIQCAFHRPQMATVRPHSFRPLPPDPQRKGVINRMPVVIDHDSVRMTVQRQPNDHAELSIQDAERIVVVGRGLRSTENLPAIFQFAKTIHAAVGATREAVDRGWLPYACQIGLSGKTVTPKLYIGLGVSGAIQHLAGMQTAETIVAVNKDPDAQIFKTANFGIVGDLMDVLPALTDQLKKGTVQ